MNSKAPIKLRIPRQDLGALTLFSPEADAVRTWVRGLPSANTRAVARELQQAIGELNRFALPPELRHDIMQALLPSLSVALSSLSKRLLNQPLVLPEETLQMATLADSLYELAGTAHIITAIEALQQRDSITDTNPARLVCEAIQRAVAFAGAEILLTFQLYRPVAMNGWLTLHQLYALAERQQLADLPVADHVSGERSIAETYLQALMLGCCKPNQLRQVDLAAIYRGLHDWAGLIRMENSPGAEGLFLVDLDSDRPPLYSSLFSDPPYPSCRYIDTSPLIEHLATLRSQGKQPGKGGFGLDRDTVISPQMLDHLAVSLGQVSVRTFARVAAGQTIKVSLGLSSTHYHVAGERVFEHLLFGDDYIPPAADRVATNPFLVRQERGDMWQQANPEEDYTREEAGTEAEAEIEHQVQLDQETMAELELNENIELPPAQRYPVFQANLVNAGPGGYCLEWSSALPGNIRTGDIVCVREDAHQDWIIAVIRWISQLESAETLVGLELLSPKAIPYGGRIHLKQGKSPPMRVLMLPEIKMVGQPQTLITPRSGFRERQKITLIREGKLSYIQLSHQVAMAENFAQFEFRYIRDLGEVAAEDRSGPLDSPYDSLWGKI